MKSICVRIVITAVTERIRDAKDAWNLKVVLSVAAVL